MAITQDQLDLLGQCTGETIKDLLDGIRAVLCRGSASDQIKVWLGTAMIGAGRDILEALGCTCGISVDHPTWPLPMAYQTPSGNDDPGAEETA